MTHCKQVLEKAYELMQVPWVQGGTDWRGADCFGIVILGSRHIFGVEIDFDHVYVSERERGAIVDRERKNGKWKQVKKPQPGSVVVVVDHNGEPTHYGLMLTDNNVLHSGSSHGVVIEPLTMINCKRVEFYDHTAA